MEDWKKEYDNIKVPEEMREKLEQSINRAKKEKKRMKKITLYKTFGAQNMHTAGKSINCPERAQFSSL